MIIKGNGFQLEQVKKTPFFNLKMDTIVNAGKEKEREDSTIVGYGMSFLWCIKYIIHAKLNTTLEDKIISPKKYIELYTAITNNIINSLKILDIESIDPEIEEDDNIE